MGYLANKNKREPLRAPFYIWCRQQESNPRPTDYKSVALPSELYRLKVVAALLPGAYWSLTYISPAAVVQAHLRSRRTHCSLYLYTRDLALAEGLEPPTIRLEGGCSIQLSYGRKTL